MFRRKKRKSEEEKVKEKVTYLPFKPEYELIDEYWVVKPFAKVKIGAIPELGGQVMYFVEEVKLSPEEKKVLDKLIDILSVELEPPESFEIDVREHVKNEARRLLQKYRRAFRKLSEESWEKIVYYVERDLLGYGPIEVMMRDPKLEDISCDGVNRAVHVWHREYESIPSNVIFLDKEYLRDFIIKLAHMAGKHISAAFPIVDAMLPGRHRLAATYGEEISPRGSTFTIRKFREKPLSIIDIIEGGDIDEWTAAYLWLMLENRMTLMVIGATAAGKTTLLNALTCFFKPGFKVVTIEETPELNLPHENWVQLVTRESYGLGEEGVGEITLYDLVKVSLRYRPDYIIVGEVRGEEAFVLFQAMSTGHGGLSTIHADSLEAAIKRLVSPPMNVSPTYIPSLNIALLRERVVLPRGGFSRRVRYVWEVEDYGKYRVIVRWNPALDRHERVSDSYLLQRLAYKLGKTVEELEEEIEKRRVILTWMRVKGIREIRDVAKVIYEYYVKPDELYKRCLAELKQMGIRIRKVPKRVAVAVATGKGSVTYSREVAVQAKVQQPPASRPPGITSRTVTAEERRGAVEKLAVPQVPPAKYKILSIIKKLGGEADHSTLLSLTNLKGSELTRILKELASSRLIVPTLTYVDGKPLLGYKLTKEGEEYLSRVTGAS